MSTKTLQEYKLTDIQFKVKGLDYKFSVINNMPESKGLSVESAVHNWIIRTDNYSAKSFCAYVGSKNTGYVCVMPTLSNIKKYKIKK